MKFLKITKEKVLDIFFPDHMKCIICGNEISHMKYDICDRCYEHLPFIVGRTCERCGQRIKTDDRFCDNCKRSGEFFFTRAFSPLQYTDTIVGLVHKLKYHNHQYLAANMAEVLYDKLSDEEIKCDVIMPVPMMDRKKKRRGYNQAELIAQELAKLSNMPIDTTTLIRVWEDNSQTALTSKERRENVRGCFKCTSKDYKGKNILLIDDVYTTGSTANECARVLRKQGRVANVYVLTFAHSEENKNIQGLTNKDK